MHYVTEALCAQLAQEQWGLNPDQTADQLLMLPPSDVRALVYRMLTVRDGLKPEQSEMSFDRLRATAFPKITRQVPVRGPARPTPKMCARRR